MSTPGWYPDPSGIAGSRYFNGAEWTAQFVSYDQQLSDAIHNEVSRGAVLVSRAGNRAVLMRPGLDSTAHIVFAVMSFLTCGIAIIPWLIAVVAYQQRRFALTVDASGRVRRDENMQT